MKPPIQSQTFRLKLFSAATLFAGLAFCASVHAQATSFIEGQVTDQNGAVVHGVVISLVGQAIGVERTAVTDELGRYFFAAVPVGEYRLEVKAHGFQAQILENVQVEVRQRITQNFQLTIGDVSEQVTVTPVNNLIERGTISVGQVIDKRMVQEVPLNGRYFTDLGLLSPGSVTPPQNGFSTVPIRGSGSFAINTAGNREDTVNFLINGITLNNPWFSSLAFQPSISSIQEFKVDNSTLSAEYGQNSGAVVNIATRSGSNTFHGELFEFFRNDALDARNFFDFKTSKPPPFKRNQFGGSLGGPFINNKIFFFTTYEGVRHRQGLNLNSLVLSDLERASVSDPVVAKLLSLIPRANFIDASGTARFIGPATATVNIDNWSIDVVNNLSEKDRLHGFYFIQWRRFVEPNRFGNTIPRFGNAHRSLRQLLTLNETHTFGPSLVNEARLGFNRIYGRDRPVAQLNPAEFGITIGVQEPIGLPQINIAGGLNFGGPTAVPIVRGDTVLVAADTVNYLIRQHSLKFGGEFRQFLNNLSRANSGTFNFPTVADFVHGTANSFSITLGDQSTSVAQPTVGFFVQDNYTARSNLTLELGLRYEWNITPTERYDRFIVFDPQTSSLLRVGTHIDEIYAQNNTNFQPRVGFAWTPFSNGKTVLRAGYTILVDQPLTSIVAGRGTNPPLAIPLTFAGPITFDNALTRAQAAGLSPLTVDPRFRNACLQSWNLNVQRELTSKLALMVGYFGSKGSHLTIRRNLNQPMNGVRPFPALSSLSPILPGVALGNITQTESTGNSNYNALWVNAYQRLARGFQFNASYTLSKSIDYNSLSLQGIVVQDSFNLRGDRGLSDFDARHRFVVSAIYDLPFRGNEFVEGWQFAGIVQVQSGNPVNLVTGNSTINGVTNTVRPNVTAPIIVTRNVDQWFEPDVFAAAPAFGNLGRNVVIGPGFNNTDFSVIKNVKISEQTRVQFRAEFFDLFNHPNFGQPGNVLGTPGFGRITNTRFPTGESGSSRQIQFALKVIR